MPPESLPASEPIPADISPDPEPETLQDLEVVLPDVAVPLPETLSLAAFGQSLTLAAPPDDFLRKDTIWRLREIYEPALAAQTLAAQGVALDIGAGFGGFALPFARAFPGWTVWCFEPEPQAFARLKLNIETLGLDNVLAVNVAVAEAGPAEPQAGAALRALAADPRNAQAMADLLRCCPAQDYRRHLEMRGVIECGAPGDDLFEPCRFATLPAAALVALAPRLLKLTAPYAETAILQGLAAAGLDHVLGEVWTQPPSHLVYGTAPGLRQTWLPVAGVPLLKLRRSTDLTGHRPGVDVVVAMYNAKAWIVECIEAILAGASDELRVVVVDDGSTDGCGDLVAARYGNHPRVVLHRKLNGGCASARNYGRLMSDASHIAFVDADDVPGPGLYTGLLELARYTGAELVQGGFELLHDDGNGGLRHAPSYEAQDPAFQGARRHTFGTGSCCIIPAALLMAGQPTIWRRIYRRDYLDNRKIWFPEHIRAFDDQIFQLLTLQPLHNVPHLDQVHYGYRQHPGQDIRQGDARAFYSLEMFRLILKRGLTEGWNNFPPVLRSYVNTVNWSWSALRPDLQPLFAKAAAELWVFMQKALDPASFGDLPDSGFAITDFSHYTAQLHARLHDIGPSYGWAYLDGIDLHVPMIKAARA